MSVFTNPSTGAAGHAAAYTAAVLDLVGDRDPLAMLRATPASLERAVAGLTPQQMRQPERAGKWSIDQVLAHLADSEIVGAWRFRLILAHDRPPITGYDQDLWAERLRYDQADPSESLEVFAVLRRATLRLLERASADELRKVGIHAERGEESVAHIRRMFAGHDLLHLRQIERIRGAIGA